MNTNAVARRSLRPGRALAAVLLGLAVVVPATAACSAPAVETEQIEEGSDQVSEDDEAAEGESEDESGGEE